MLHKTRGIVLGFIKYKETSIICRIYTEAFGLQSYIINGVRTKPTKSSKATIAFYQPLTLLDLVVYHKKGAGLNRIAETKCSAPFNALTTDFKKMGIAMFICEVLNKTIQEESPNEPLFEFLFESLHTLDTMETSVENFHLLFLLKLSRFLGFYPSSAADLYSQLVEAAGWNEIIDKEESAALEKILSSQYGQSVPMTNKLRRSLLSHILKFYHLQVENFGEVKSLQVLSEIMS